ncbi:hypothetical protein AA0112_g12212 [Alternaria arborescens]|nr:hypothetical protein AA0112_g12212 [Alternaria arborescens]
MKLFFAFLPLLGCALGLAQDLQPDTCVATCPPPDCSAAIGALESCKCLNEREYACKAKCPDYTPRILHCPRLPVSTVSTPEPAPTACVCEEVFCVLSFPEGCYCRNNATQACFEKCGGEELTYQDCTLPIDELDVRAPEPKPVPAPAPVPVPAPQKENCVCEEIICVLSFPEGCYCRNNATRACFENCGGAEPMYQDCSLPDVETHAPEPVPEPLPLLEPQTDTCVCEDVVCIQSWPESCYCRNDADKACYEKCGGIEPVYQSCTAVDNVVARAPAPEPVPEPEAQACVCAPGPHLCPQVWPDSCYCDYNAAKACSDKCGGPAPPFPMQCPPLNPPSVEARVADPQPVPVPASPPPTCECPLVNCISSWPESCYCQNAAKKRCHELCGGKKPVLQICPPYPSSTLLTITATPVPLPVPITPVPLPSPIPPRQATPTNQICGGGRASQVLDCPAGQVCITDPFKPGSCGPACDQLGICVGEKLCGGFAGFECDIPAEFILFPAFTNMLIKTATLAIHVTLLK